MKEIITMLRSSILAGICIGIAGFGYLASGGIIGATLFAFGLLAVVHYGLKLYTGTAGFIYKKEIPDLFLILFGNIIGCLIVAMVARCSPLQIQETAQFVLDNRIINGSLNNGILAMGCGFIMTTAVKFGRQGKYLPLLFGVPLFIMCGFPHCIADAFYYLCVPFKFLINNVTDVVSLYCSIVIGNFVGCNAFRMIFGNNGM